MEVQIKSQVLYFSDRITIHRFLPAFQKTFDANGIHEGVVMCLFKYFVKKKTKSAMYDRTMNVDRKRLEKDGELTSYDTFVN